MDQHQYIKIEGLLFLKYYRLNAYVLKAHYRDTEFFQKQGLPIQFVHQAQVNIDQ